MAGKIAYKTQCLLVLLYMVLQQEREDRVKRGKWGKFFDVRCKWSRI